MSEPTCSTCRGYEPIEGYNGGSCLPRGGFVSAGNWCAKHESKDAPDAPDKPRKATTKTFDIAAAAERVKAARLGVITTIGIKAVLRCTDKEANKVMRHIVKNGMLSENS